MFSKALTSDSATSLSHLSHPSRTTRKLDETCFIPISTRTDVHKLAFPPHHLCLELCISGVPHKISTNSSWHGRKSPTGHGAPEVTGSPTAGLHTEAPKHPAVPAVCWQHNRFNSSKLGALICTNLTKSVLLYKSTNRFMSYYTCLFI
jgi:hypothetical protein